MELKNIREYKHIIWDWNGTLLDDTDFCIGIMNGMLTRRTMQNITREYYKNVFTFPVRKYYEKIGLPVDDEQFKLLSVEFIDQYEKNRLNCRLFEGVKETLQKVNAIGLSQSILSAYSQHTLQEIVEHFGLSGYFIGINGLDNIYAGSKIDLGKNWVKKLGISPGDVLLVGDTLHDYETASEIGAGCVLIADGHQDKALLSAANIPVFNSITEFRETYLSQ